MNCLESLIFGKFQDLGERAFRCLGVSQKAVC